MPRALLALGLLLLAGCDGRPTRSTKLSPPPPPPQPAPEWAGTFDVTIGRATDRLSPESRWCYLDVDVSGAKVEVKAWRPDDAKLRVVSAETTAIKTLKVVVEWQPPAAAAGPADHDGDGDDDAKEAAVVERWTLDGALEARAPRKAAEGDDGDADDELAARLVGQVTIERHEGGRTRAWTAKFEGRRLDEEQDDETALRAAFEARHTGRSQQQGGFVITEREYGEDPKPTDDPGPAAPPRGR